MGRLWSRRPTRPELLARERRTRPTPTRFYADRERNRQRGGFQEHPDDHAGRDELNVCAEATGAMPAAPTVEELAAARTQPPKDVLEGRVPRLRPPRALRDRAARARARSEPFRKRRSGSRSDGRRCPRAELDRTRDAKADRGRAQRLASPLAHQALHRWRHGERRSRSQVYIVGEDAVWDRDTIRPIPGLIKTLARSGHPARARGDLIHTHA
jgi:hypothetical protein